MESPMNIEAPTTPEPSNGQLLRPTPLTQRHQGERAALPLLSGASSSSTYLRDDDEQRPQIANTPSR